MQLLKNNSVSATFLIGGAGAGKTELALNMAVWQKAFHGQATVIDLDIVNPFFRVRKLRDHMEKLGVRLIGPEGKVAAGDMPALPRAAWGALGNDSEPVVCDIGGGEQGLRPLGRLKEFADQRKANVFFVINPYRPGFSTLAEMAESFDHMCKLSAMKATHIVANPNLSGETPNEVFVEGLELIKTFAASRQIEIAFAVVEEPLALAAGCKVGQKPEFYMADDFCYFVIERYWSVPWQFGL